jgi:2-polyprenyl-3-methyl-5-hydroxy-6-metoxy-1,4-benzoquinol methylase
VELPIPTYYGDEICHVNGMKYAKDVMAATLRNVAHRSGLLYRRQFDISLQDNSHYDLKLGYTSSHSLALDAIPAGASVIDIGSGPGGLARELANKGCKVAVVDQFPTTTDNDNIKVLSQDLDQPLQFDVGPYQYILLLDVIEHLRDPDLFLERLRKQFTHEPKTIILTTPNVAFLVQRLMLLAGQFNYGKQGILDRTHTRLYSFRSVEMLLKNAGFRVKKIRGIPAPFPKALGDNAVAHAALASNSALIGTAKSVFSYQIYVEAESTPDVEYVLKTAKNSKNSQE